MELRDLVKRFEDYEKENWICPVIKGYCDPKCYAYLPKSFSLLLEGKHPPMSWTQKFFKSEDIIQWGKSLKEKVTVTNYNIYDPYCKLLDAIITLPDDLRDIKCQNV